MPSPLNPRLHQRSPKSRFVTFLQGLTFPRRMLVIFTGGFLVGGFIEYFAITTGLYESVAMKKAVRRHEMDEFVVEFRENLAKWQQEDMERARLRVETTSSQ